LGLSKFDGTEVMITPNSVIEGGHVVPYADTEVTIASDAVVGIEGIYATYSHREKKPRLRDNQGKGGKSVEARGKLTSSDFISKQKEMVRALHLSLKH